MGVLAFVGSKVARIGVATYDGPPMRLLVLCAIAVFVSALPVCADETATVRAADGFQLPVGPNGTGEGYYIARGYRPNGHLGEDWNGVRGGDTDLGDPVYAAANGYVMFARNYHVGWGNVVILRHAYYEGLTLKYCDSLYGHLLDFSVQEGEQVRRGQKIGRIGNNFGMYDAHLHFEMRKNLQIGMFRSSFARDFSNYYTPNEFVAGHRACVNGNHMVSIPINTYPPVAPPILAGPHVQTPVFGPTAAGAAPRFTKVSPLPPVVSPSTSAPAVKVVTKLSTPAAAPSAPEPRVVKSVAAVATPTPAPKATNAASIHALASASPPPAASAKHSKATAASSSPESTTKTTASTHSVAAASPTPAASTKRTNATTAASASKPAARTAKTSTTETAATTASSTSASSTKHSKSTAASATPTPSGKASKKSTTGSSVAAASRTSAPATKTTKTVAAASTPAPAAKKSVKTPAPVAAAPTPTPAPIATGKTRKVPTASPTPRPAVAAKADGETIASVPLLPAPTTKDVAPIRQVGPNYKVDRYQDLRGKGY